MLLTEQKKASDGTRINEAHIFLHGIADTYLGHFLVKYFWYLLHAHNHAFYRYNDTLFLIVSCSLVGVAFEFQHELKTACRNKASEGLEQYWKLKQSVAAVNSVMGWKYLFMYFSFISCFGMSPEFFNDKILYDSELVVVQILVQGTLIWTLAAHFHYLVTN